MAQLTLKSFLITIVFCNYVLAQGAHPTIPIVSCNGVQTTGKILEARVAGCANNFPCILRRGGQTTIEFDYIPSYSVNRITTGATAVLGGVTLPFVGTNNTPACPKIVSKQTRQSVGCNQNGGEVYTYSSTFPIRPIYPATSVQVQWELVDSATRQKIVCLQIPARIV